MCAARRFLLALLLLLAPVAGRAADVPVAEDTSSAASGLSSGAGKSKSLAVQESRAALLRFSLASLPPGYDADTLQSARLRVYATKVASAGDLTVHEITTSWSESGGAVPTVDATPIADVAGADVRARSFLVVDVTETVRMYNGVGTLVDNDFSVLVTGR